MNAHLNTPNFPLHFTTKKARAAQALQDLLHPHAPPLPRDPADYIRRSARHPDDA